MKESDTKPQKKESDKSGNDYDGLPCLQAKSSADITKGLVQDKSASSSSSSFSLKGKKSKISSSKSSEKSSKKSP